MLVWTHLPLLKNVLIHIQIWLGHSTWQNTLAQNSYIFHIKLTLDGLKGPAKALTAITGSFGLLGNHGDRFSIGSGDQGAPITGWEELSVALNKGTYNRSVANQKSVLELRNATNQHFLSIINQCKTIRRWPTFQIFIYLLFDLNFTLFFHSFTNDLN